MKNQNGVSATLGKWATGDMANRMRRRRMRTGTNKSISGGGGSGAGSTSGSTRSETVKTTIIIVDVTLKAFGVVVLLSRSDGALFGPTMPEWELSFCAEGGDKVRLL
ncbi:hypothetical protein TorRG33x02_152890 [Trema orientale]|uniref:Uncharacterized protein n=1 Tax=Trema orientale TaxID=63057 RepID=A0A2P5ETS4_TREOI|nr:hypothetical protein TorRG33x02_152890 [Trema orientale]